MNKKSVEQKSIEQKVNWASGYLNKYLIDQIPTGQMHLNKITGTIEQMLNWTNCHSRAIQRLRLAECVVARSAMKPGGFGGLAPILYEVTQTLDNFHAYPNHNYPSHNWSKPWVLEDVIISSNPWRLSCLSKPHISKPQLIQTMSSVGCNNFLKPLTNFIPHPNHNYPSHNWSKPWVLEDVIISSNPDNFPSLIQTTFIQHM